MASVWTPTETADPPRMQHKIPKKKQAEMSELILFKYKEADEFHVSMGFYNTRDQVYTDFTHDSESGLYVAREFGKDEVVAWMPAPKDVDEYKRLLHGDA